MTVAGGPPVVPDDRRADDPVTTDRVLTLPNVLSVLRLVGIPVFLWLILGPHLDVLALVVLMLSGASDWLDGKLARAWGQVSRVGQLLDPLADRLYILSTLAAFVIRDVIPLWLALLLIGRDVVLALCLPALRRYGYGPLPVHFLGKAATFNLLYAFPLLLLAAPDSPIAAIAGVARPLGWAFTWWGTGLYWWAGALYVVQAVQLVRAAMREPVQAR